MERGDPCMKHLAITRVRSKGSRDGLVIQIEIGK